MKELTTIALLGVLILISGSFKIPFANCRWRIPVICTNRRTHLRLLRL